MIFMSTMIFHRKKLKEKQKICMRKIKLIWLLCCNIIFANPIPPYAHLWEIQPIEVLEVDTEINWKNSGLSNQEALEHCKNTQSLPKDSKQMEQYLKKHIVVWSLHYFSGAGCTYKGKVKFAGKIWNFVSIGGITRITTESEWIGLVCISKDCYPQAWSDGE